ncbi:disease resistance protein RPV1-like [Syzygium oleosum]|uniref:disease resistance protein RPV1-like n=1 Tax=Syzygium oleosum TaxID=219896 RepID=UPI0024BAD10E|nr:disease resistance protein RPV1-like [Syzygium oleosum]
MEERQPKRAKFTEASSSSTSVIGNNYYVFLSFRGLDTRNGFVDHLYHKLVDVGLPFHPNFVFRDDEKLPFGEDIATNLISAIEQSKVSIPVISENYATSEWCLRELIHIMKCQKKGQKVLTVFYKVKPSEVREVRTSDGAFGKAFRSSMHLFKDDVKEEGPEALREAAASRIFESDKFASGHEGELVKELVRVIMDEQQHDFLPPLPGNLVGIDDRVAQVMKLADTNPSETRIIGICGIGGIGKTTLATNIYNKLSKKFECRSFLRDIRETINRKGMEHVQHLLISDITQNLPGGVRDSVRGIRGIQLSCENKEVLIFLDDVGHRDHIDKLIGGCKFKPGSRIIITCRDKALLKSEYERYELEHMNFKDSMLLFSSYAFGAKQPPTKLANLSSDIVATTGGLPLALEITGSLLKGKPENIWIETLEKLKKVPNKDVQKVLRITYDSLKYEEQQMFLDIACFFIGIDKRIAIYLWNDILSCQDSGLDRLTQLSLIKFDDVDKLRMHDHLSDLGRAIACPANKKPWECSRLWGEEAITVQRSKEENRNIEALRLDRNGSIMFMGRKSFKRMPYLKFLHLSKVRFVGDFKDSLSELRWLEWEKCPCSFKATNVHLEKLLILDLSDGNISENWEGWRSIKMERLKVLNLSGCNALKRTPDLSKFKSLEMLILESCVNLEKIDPSIGDVECLASLNLSNCRSLKKLPSRLGQLKGLVSLNLSSCSGLKKLPSRLGELKGLVSLNLSSCLGLKELPSQVGELKGLVSLDLSSCSGLQELPSQLGELKGLVSLKLSSCGGLQELPKEIGKLEKLKELAIDGVKIKEIPSSIGFLKELEILDALGCESLVGLPDSIGQLENLSTLDLRFCDKFEGFPESIGSLVKLQRLLLGNIPPPSLQGHMNSWDYSDDFCFDRIPPSIGKLESLTELHLTCAKISKLPKSIGKLKKLKILKISRCAKLSSLPRTISELGELEELEATECHSLGGEVPINGLSSLKILRLGKISDDEYLFAKHLSSRQHLDLTKCDLPASLTVLEVTCHNRTLPKLSHLIHLGELNLQLCEYLESIPELPLGILSLCIFWCGKLKMLPDLSSLVLLLELRILGCSELKEIRGLERLKSLRELSIHECKKLSDLKFLEQLEFLRDLEMVQFDAPQMNDDLSQV